MMSPGALLALASYARMQQRRQAFLQAVAKTWGYVKENDLRGMDDVIG